jgi:ketosteroid isomerase-like protein
MRRRPVFLFLVPILLVLGGNAASGDDPMMNLEDELRAAETAFARTMADRDLEAFKSFLASETVFFTGNQTLRGPEAVAEAWARFFEGEAAPFSWGPEAVAVLESGTLGFSSGPVLSPEGERIGTFNSVWRRLDEGKWEIVFDRGCP